MILFIYYLVNCGNAGFEVFEVFFVPSHTSTYLEHFCTHSHREAVAPAIGKPRES